jgi:outer membrane protein OmpA-like peptidoglycan-associated protein
MQKKLYFPMSLIAVAILSGCNSVPKNSSLTEAHSSYNNARSSPQVTSLAAVELKDASDTLNKADAALNKGENGATVDHLAYIANQQVGIAQETAKRKTSELAITNAGVKRDKARLEARTAEADTAKQQVAVMQGEAAQKTAELAERTAEADAAEQQVANSRKIADQQAAALAKRTAEVKAAEQQVANVGKIADQQAAALVAANANAERDSALIAQQETQLKELKELNAKKTDRGLVITLGDVLFSSNKAQLKSGGTRNVLKLAYFLKQHPQHKVLVEGYTDSTGSDSLNQKLSDQRANNVRTALIGMGISGDRVITHGYGKTFPVASNDTAASRQLNRRVEIIISDDKGNIATR